MNSDEMTDLRRQELEKSKRLWNERMKSVSGTAQEDCQHNAIYGEIMPVMRIRKDSPYYLKPKFMETNWNISTNIAIPERHRRKFIELEYLLRNDVDE